MNTKEVKQKSIKGLKTIIYGENPLCGGCFFGAVCAAVYSIYQTAPVQPFHLRLLHFAERVGGAAVCLTVRALRI